MKHTDISGKLLLGIECGGTRTSLLLVGEGDQVLAERQDGPANLRLLTDTQLWRHFQQLSQGLPRPTALAIGMAGARTEADQARILRAAARVWRGVPCRAAHDLETGLATAGPLPHGRALRSTGAPQARVLVLSGTGSCCYGRNAQGVTAKMGGWGHLLGDKGSGYDIALRALKAVVFYLDRDEEWSRLGQRFLRALLLNEPNDLVGWLQTANKTAVAALAVEVFAAAQERDPIARDVLAGAISSLAKDAAACAGKLSAKGRAVEFVLAGSVLLRQPGFARRVAAELRRLWPAALVRPLPRASVWGAVELARSIPTRPSAVTRPARPAAPAPASARADLDSWARLSPTEQRHPRSMHLDRQSVTSALRLMVEEDRRVPQAIRPELGRIARVIADIAKAWRRGGRLFYVGAGTSGRLGVLDASECPPTFRSSPEMVQGIMAGGQRALWESVEGAEDDAGAGGRAVRYRGVRRGDVLVGIAASGRTPFVWGALRAARKRGARTVLLCFNPHLAIPRGDRPDVVIAPNVGPEILTGSTRLKAGTATKLVLNMITTLAMVRIGKVRSNLMIDVHASNEKLRHRAARIVQALMKVDEPAAVAALKTSAWRIPEACRSLARRRRSTASGRAGRVSTSAT